MVIWCRLGFLLMDWCRFVVVYRWCMECSDVDFSMVWGSPVLCSQRGPFSVMRLCVSAGSLDLSSVGWQLCCFQGCRSGLSASCCVSFTLSLCR